ncbi:hypothetical protein CPB83DRAFT_71400 [Crepidotus variabilis]|uniref:Uncharacterized protein n=1 Tax=Crepidotus variabilis TaxID=179855 RepID=A0A9P6JJ52_9AGAR|nr:hypothetical protein CPB83DRAFT_71400 [Crepidotus variabilis]
MADLIDRIGYKGVGWSSVSKDNKQSNLGPPYKNAYHTNKLCSSFSFAFPGHRWWRIGSTPIFKASTLLYGTAQLTTLLSTGETKSLDKSVDVCHQHQLADGPHTPQLKVTGGNKATRIPFDHFIK